MEEIGYCAMCGRKVKFDIKKILTEDQMRETEILLICDACASTELYRSEYMHSKDNIPHIVLTKECNVD